MPVDYQFGPFGLDAKLGILLRGGEPVGIGQRAVALLRLLLERAGEPVSKDDLIAAAWPGLAIEDSNLTVQMTALRKALGEADGAAWIETLARRGYRYIGPPVTTRHLGTSTSDLEPALALPTRPSVVVMPFANLGNDPEQEYFTDGVVDDIITGLARIIPARLHLPPGTPHAENCAPPVGIIFLPLATRPAVRSTAGLLYAAVGGLPRVTGAGGRGKASLSLSVIVISLAV
jgi:DNA-binding winged helix-turn-helix (wHTH) protein